MKHGTGKAGRTPGASEPRARHEGSRGETRGCCQEPMTTRIPREHSKCQIRRGVLISSLTASPSWSERLGNGRLRQGEDARCPPCHRGFQPTVNPEARGAGGMAGALPRLSGGSKGGSVQKEELISYSFVKC